jgi:hypothetical protein
MLHHFLQCMWSINLLYHNIPEVDLFLAKIITEHGTRFLSYYTIALHHKMRIHYRRSAHSQLQGAPAAAQSQDQEHRCSGNLQLCVSYHHLKDSSNAEKRMGICSFFGRSRGGRKAVSCHFHGTAVQNHPLGDTEYRRICHASVHRFSGCHTG